MKRAGIFKSMPRLAALLVIALLLAAVVALMGYVQNLLNSDVKINLTEIVTQNKDVIVSKLQVEVNNLDLVANQMAERLAVQTGTDEERLAQAFASYLGSNPDDTLFMATRDGTALFPDGSTVDVAGRSYFQLAMQGEQNISDRTISRISGDEMFVISVPLRLGGEVVGTVQRIFTPDQMYELCSVSLFSDQGSLYIVNGEGYILVSSTQSTYNQESENYFRTLYSQGNQEASQQLQADLQNNTSSFMETEIDGVRYFSAYTPIENVHDWFLVSTVPTSTASPNAGNVISIFYVVLFVVVLIFAASMFLFLSYKKRQQDALETIAFVDPVTGGDTYNKFVVDLEDTLRAHPEKRFGLLAFDIDNFKYLNSFYGFAFGDRVLRTIDRTVGELLTQHEHLARVSSDHFVALLEDPAETRINTLMDAVRARSDVAIYLSAGLYPITDAAESANLMVDKANTAARASKGSLRTKVGVYSSEHDELVARNEQMKRSVEQALERDELVPYYQPKIDVNTGRIVGAEALVRWKKEDGTLVAPGAFIPLCEQSGLIVEVDMTVLDKVLRFIRGNLDEGVDCAPISVNFSRLHLLDRDFLSKVDAKLQEQGVPARYLEVEITESVIFDNNDVIAAFAAQLHEMGLAIAMDDFGSGYSSLNMLKDIPIDVLKIDQGFLQETSDSKRQAIIFDSVARMAARLRISVVVEGVETAEHVALMKRFGCSVAQGYYFAKPQDEETFEPQYRKGTL